MRDTFQDCSAGLVMHVNRLLALRRAATSSRVVAPNRPVNPVPFAVCPVFVRLAPWQLQLYQAAYEKAKADAEAVAARTLFQECWN